MSTIYSTISFGASLSQFVELAEVQHDRMRAHERGTTEPTVKMTGLVWNRTDYSVIGDAWVRWNGSSWTLMLDPEYAQLNAGGTVAAGANLPMGGFVLTGLGAGSANGHSVRYEQVMLLSGVNAMGADLAMGSHKITGLAAPTASGHAARYDEVFANGVGRFLYTEDADVQTDAAPTTSYNHTGFTPRKVTVRLSGEVRDQSDNDLHGTIDFEGTYTRWNDLTPGKTLIGTQTVGSKTINVYVEPEYTPGDGGYYISVERSDTSERQNVAYVHTIVEYGLGQ